MNLNSHRNMIFLLVLVASLLASSMQLRQENTSLVSENIPAVPATIKSGDLVFRRGRGIFSEIFRDIGGTGSPFSHVGIVYIDNSSIFVLHTEANELTGIGHARKEKIDSFISKEHALSYAFFRVTGLDADGRASVLETALEYVRNRVPFDTSFSLEGDDRLYCSELVYKAFKSAQIYLVDSPSILRIPGFSVSGTLEAITIAQLLKSSNIQPIPIEK